MQNVVHKLPLLIELPLVSANALDQNSILEEQEFFIFPKHRQISEVDHIEEWLPEAGFSFLFLMPEPENHSQVLMIIMRLKKSRVLVVDYVKLGYPLANVLVSD